MCITSFKCKMEKQPLNRIKVMLAERMLTNKELAEMLGKDPATISKWVTFKIYSSVQIDCTAESYLCTRN